MTEIKEEENRGFDIRVLYDRAGVSLSELPLGMRFLWGGGKVFELYNSVPLKTLENFKITAIFQSEHEVRVYIVATEESVKKGESQPLRRLTLGKISILPRDGDGKILPSFYEEAFDLEGFENEIISELESLKNWTVENFVASLENVLANRGFKEEEISSIVEDIFGGDGIDEEEEKPEEPKPEAQAEEEKKEPNGAAPEEAFDV